MLENGALSGKIRLAQRNHIFFREKHSLEDKMLYTIAGVLVILWLLGIISGYTMGSFIHILLVVAVIVILVNFIQGRRTL